MKEALKPILELCTTENCSPNEVFYRYRVGHYIVWFVQHQDNGKRELHQNTVGCIFQVHIQLDEGAKGFPLKVFESIGAGKGYPNTFEIDTHAVDSVQVGNYIQFMLAMEYSKNCLAEIVNLFLLSDHYQLFKKRAFLERPEAQNGTHHKNSPADDAKKIVSRIREMISTDSHSDIGSRLVEGQFMIDIMNCLNFLLRDNDRLTEEKALSAAFKVDTEKAIATLSERNKNLQEENAHLNQERLEHLADYNAEVLKNDNLAQTIFSEIVAQELGTLLLDKSAELSSVSISSLKAVAEKHGVII